MVDLLSSHISRQLANLLRLPELIMCDICVNTNFNDFPERTPVYFRKRQKKHRFFTNIIKNAYTCMYIHSGMIA